MDNLVDNAVFLRGRLAAPASERELPSGDAIVSFRLIVARPDSERVKVDTIDCAAVRARPRRTAARAAAGDVLEVEGALQRRFWRGPSGPSSRYEVRADAVRIVSAKQPAGRRSGASAARMPASA